jgi:hypothetical protein
MADSGLGNGTGQGVPNSGQSRSGGEQKFIGNNERWNNTAQTDHPVRAFIDRYTPQLGQQLTTSDAQGVAKKFPSMIEKGDPRDDYYAFKSGLINGDGIIPGAGLAVASDADVAYLRKKGDDTIEAAYRAFLLDTMDLSSPEKQDYWQKNFPGVFQEKIKLVESQLELQLKLAKLRILGPRTEEDYMLLFAIQHGYIAIPQGPVFNPDALEKTDFHRGLFNVKKWLLTDDSRKVSLVDPLEIGAKGNYPAVTRTVDWQARGSRVGPFTGGSTNMASSAIYGSRR